jgi:hypothetical protein
MKAWVQSVEQKEEADHGEGGQSEDADDDDYNSSMPLSFALLYIPTNRSSLVHHGRVSLEHLPVRLGRHQSCLHSLSLALPMVHRSRVMIRPIPDAQ